MPGEASCTTEEKVVGTVSPVTSTGKVAKVDGAPVWTVMSGSATLVPAADGLSCEIISGDVAEDSTGMVTADADLGQGIIEISDTWTLHVTAVNAQNVGLSFGAAVPK